MRRLRPLVLATAVAGAALAGCASSPSKARFLTQSDRICATAGAPVASLATPTSFPELSEAAGRVADATGAQVRQLRKLSRPKGARAATDKVFASLAAAQAAASRLRSAAAANDEKGSASAANRLTAESKAAADGARAYGFGTCGPSTEKAANTTVEGARNVIKAGFVLKAESLCKEASRKLDALPTPRSAAEASRTLGSGIIVLNQLVAQLGDLVVPPGEEGVAAEYLDAQRKVITQAEELKRAADANDRQLFAAKSDENDRLTTAANAKADALGLLACGTEASF